VAKDITRVSVRKALKPRRDPYWWRLAEGRYIGFRRMSASSPGAWLARFYDGEKYHYKPLDEQPGNPEEKRYDEAKRQAEEWFQHLDLGGSNVATSVKAACEAYAAHLRSERSEVAAKDAEGNFRRLVNDDPIGKIELAKLKPVHVNAWRERILNRGSKTYFNRNLTPLRAALRLAKDRGLVASDFAWSKALRPLKLDPSEGRRSLYLDPAQRRRLLEKASDELKPLLRSWMLLPLRPGDVAKLRVEDLDVKQKALRIPKGKTASRLIPLPAEAFEHFKARAKDKLPQAWLVARADGRQWDRFVWRDEMQAAVKVAKLPRATVAYTLRHSTITDLVTAGVDLFTVARLSGTSIAMIDKHYGQLQQEHARKALEQLTLKL